MEINKREDLEAREKKILAPYAAFSSLSKGRQYFEAPHPYRTCFQRDRERIIHSRAFRRLEYKTQVFLNHEGDHFRTRLTHSIEVAQIAKTIARTLSLNEDLTESIALAHDLGHTPFGHAGEYELDRLLQNAGGFEHNKQSLRVVDVLENNYPQFKGLNLTWETREGIIKHSSEYDSPDASDFKPEEMPSLEAQIIDLADEIAYNNHDIDDGFRSGLLNIEDIEKLRIWNLARQNPSRKIPETRKMLVRQMNRIIINILVSDLIAQTGNTLERLSIQTYEDVRKAKRKIIGFSQDVIDANNELKTFLQEKLYHHFKVTRMTLKAQRVLNGLYQIYTEHPDTLPESYQERIAEDGLERTVADYIAGMTDRYALEEHQKLTDPMIRV